MSDVHMVLDCREHGHSRGQAAAFARIQPFQTSTKDTFRAVASDACSLDHLEDGKAGDVDVLPVSPPAIL